jgi:acyl-coenzyme A synthetase/AMP-(fatty) acid ligase
VSVAGTRRVPLADLYADDGAAHLRLGRGEVLARVLVPAASSTSDYRKARQRGAIDFPLAGVAGTLALRGGVLTQLRIALTGTNSRPFLLEGTADLLGRSIDDDLLEALGKLVQKQVSPMRTTVTPSNYRRQVAAALARRLVRALAEQEPTKASAPGPTPASTVDLEPAREERVSATAMTMNAAELLLDGGDPGHAALACGADTLTYAQLRDTVARAAAVWKGLGVVRGDRIAIKLADGIPWVSAFLGAIWAGGVAVGVNPRIPGDDYENILRDGGFRLILAEALEGTPPRLRERVVLLGPWWSAVAVASPVAPVAMEANAPALWTHSSGTSGRPKAVVHAHRFAQHAEDVSAQFLGIRVDDRLFASSKLFFAYPQANSLFAGLKIGATVIVDPQWPTAESVVATIVAQRPTVLFSVPSLYRTLLKEGVAREAVAHGVRICVSAGEALSETLRYEWRRQTGMAIVNGYGASETLVLALVNRGDGDWLTASPGIEVESVAGAGNANPTQISIRGPTLALGYWNRPDADAAHFRDGAFCPSDLFEHNAQGQWRFVGRDDALVKIRGRWVNLAELEERLAAASPAVSEAAAVSVQDADGVDAIAFFYVVKPGPPEDVADRLRALAGTLPHYQRPRWLFEIAALPRTATGKLLRRKLRELHRTVA